MLSTYCVARVQASALRIFKKYASVAFPKPFSPRAWRGLRARACFSFRHRGLGLVFGNLAQGFSVSWWKDKHNRHHAVPNVHGGEGGSLFGDPDVDTMPLLAW